MNLQKLIDNKGNYAKFMLEEITHICKDMKKRSPGSEGEKQACEYMAGVLKDECGCEKSEVESFKEHPKAFYGWLFLTFTSAFIGIVLLFFLPVLSILFIAFGFFLAFIEFGLYKQFVDKLFKEETGHNVTAVKKCSGETKRRIVFNGHPDAAWEWPVNYKLGGIGFEGHAIISILGALYYLILSIIAVVQNGVGFNMLATGTPFFKACMWGLIFVPFMFGMFFMVNYKRVVDGANDNLSGCYMGIAVLKALKDEGITLENTEVVVALTGSEEAGLRGSKAWCEQHKGEFDDVPTFIFSYDTIHDPKYLMANYRDLNGTVAADKDVSDLFMEAAAELSIPCKKGWVPPLGGATDSAAFAQAGLRATGITGLNHKLESYYHTRKDSYDNMDLDGLAGCYAVSVKALEMFDNGAKQ